MMMTTDSTEGKLLIIEITRVTETFISKTSIVCSEATDCLAMNVH